MLLWWRRTLPESPRYLLARGRTREAEAVVSALERDVERAIGRPLPSVPDVALSGMRSTNIANALRFVWSPRIATRTAVVGLIWFAQAFSFNWIPTLLFRRDTTVTSSVEFAIIAYIALMLGYASAVWVNERIDRKRTIALCLTGGMLSALSLSQVTTSLGIMTAGAALLFFLNGTYGALYAYTPEVFPTSMRATGMGVSSACGRLGLVIAPRFSRFLVRRLGFSDAFAGTTTVVGLAAIVVLWFGLSTAGLSLEELSHDVEPVGTA